jgi:eukaryotic-like serine/threonine-protein kinase
LRSRYTFERELGRGGMATVYLARDLKHDRSVALKVLHPELAATLGPARFLQEIQVTARLQHPHILPLIDSGEASGLVYYLMPYVEGESLRERLRREKQLPTEDALRISREVALALGYAHRQGVVHRDIKPENILLSDNQALVADFGVARAVEAAGGERLTETGLSVGTPSYMSPEQAAGERDLDSRTDIYSLGCVLYEMLVGEAPFSGPSARAIAARHSFEPMPSIRVVRPTVSEAIEQVIRRSMAKVPSDRFATAAEFADALTIADREEGHRPDLAPHPRPLYRHRRIGILVAAVGFAALIAAGAVLSRGRPERNASITSLAVLPLASATPDTSIEYLEDGLTETLINSLSNIPKLRVTARSAVFRFRGKSTNPSEIGRELGVQAVLTWSLRRHGDRLSVQTELLKVADGSRLWGAQYDRAIADVLDLQQKLAQAVAQQLTSEPKGTHAEVVVKPPTISPEAFELYSRARFLLNRRTGREVRDTAAQEMAREYYEQALAKDPNFALAWSGLAKYYSYKGNWGKAEPLVRRAIAIDSTSGDAWGDLGIVLTYGHQDDDGAGRAFERGVALGPVHPDAHWYYGEWLLMRRRFDEAIEQMQKAVALDPVDVMSNAKLGWALMVARRYDGAIAQLQKAQELAPNDFAPLKLLAHAYERKGMYPEAVEAKQKSLLFEGDTVQASKLGKAYAARGVKGYWEVRRAALLEELAELEQRARGGDVDTTGLIWVHAQLGNREPAFALLGQVAPMELRGILWIWLVDSLRSDPRFGALVRKAGLPLIEGER